MTPKSSHATARAASTDRKEELVDAALALFRERGIAGVSTRDLAEHAGLSRSHVYHYFSDWNALRLAAFEKFAHAEIQLLEEELAGLAPRAALAAFVKLCLPVRGDPAWTLWIDVWDEALHDDALAQSYALALAQIERILLDAIEGGVQARVFACENTGRAARQIMALVNGYADDLLLQPSPKKARAAQEEIMQAATTLLSAT